MIHGISDFTALEPIALLLEQLAELEQRGEKMPRVESGLPIQNLVMQVAARSLRLEAQNFDKRHDGAFDALLMSMLIDAVVQSGLGTYDEDIRADEVKAALDSESAPRWIFEELAKQCRVDLDSYIAENF